MIPGIIEGGGEAVFSFDPATGEFLVWNGDDQLSDLLTIDAGRGYIVELNSPRTMTVTGFQIEPGASTPPTFPMAAGWNLVGVHSPDPVQANNYLPATATSAWGSDPISGPSKVDIAADNLEAFRGYWVFFTAADTIVP